MAGFAEIWVRGNVCNAVQDAGTENVPERRGQQIRRGMYRLPIFCVPKMAASAKIAA